MKVARRLVFVACFVALVGCQVAASPAPSNVATSAASTSAPPSATVTPGPSGQALLPSSGAITDASFGSVIATADGFLASGSTGTSAVMAAGSEDGRAWQPLAADRVFHHPLVGIAVGPLGWVGVEGIDTPDAGDIGTVLWHATDGRSWVQVPDQAELGTSLPGRVAAGSWGFAMLGQSVDGFGTSVGRVWVSRDGLEWRQTPRLDWDSGQIVALPDGFLALGPESAAITTDGISWIDAGPLPGKTVIGDATAAPLGADVLAVFSVAGGASVWRGTVDGPPTRPTVTWSEAGLGLTSDSMLVALAAGPLGALVLGYDRQTLQPITWVSSDGRTWQRTDLEESAFGGGVPTIVAVGDSAFVVLGWFGNEGGDVVARPWISTDGLAWAGSEPEQLGVLPGLPSEPCPSTDPTEAAQLIAMAGSYPTIPEAAWTLCFENRQLTLRGYVGDCGGCGGVSQFRAVPDWLLSPLGFAQFWLLATPPTDEGRGLSISVQIDPRHPVPVPETGAHVRITGHFDDPAAQGCRLIPTEAGAAFPPIGPVIAGCRHQFVVTAIKVLAN